MALVNKGFPGTVNATHYAKSWHLGGSDACNGAGWLVSQGTGRQTSTAAGDAFASGVLSENSAPILTSLSTPTNGQWFLIVRRIDWAGAGTVTVAAVAHTTTSTTIPTVAPSTFPTINDNPGVLYDQKLAWAWVRSTDTSMVLFDLRELPLEPRLQVIEIGAGRGNRAVLYAASPAALHALAAIAQPGDIGVVAGDGINYYQATFSYVGTFWQRADVTLVSASPSQWAAAVAALAGGGASIILNGGRARLDSTGAQLTYNNGTFRRTGLVPIIPTVSGTGVTVDAYGKVTFTASPLVGVLGCFTTEFENYVIKVRTTVRSSAVDLLLRLKVGATTDASTAYYSQRQSSTGGTPSSSTLAASSTGWYMDASGQAYMTSDMDILAPQLATQTQMNSKFSSMNSAMHVGVTSGFAANATQYDGMELNGNGANLTGVLEIYGYGR